MTRAVKKSVLRGPRTARNQRRGVVLVLSALSMVVIIGFVAFSIDIGSIALTQARMQTGADAAALAATQEIAQAVAQAGASQGDSSDAIAAAEAAAREKARAVAEANGIYINPTRDVSFGNRAFNEASQKWEVNWGEQPYNAVKVVAHRDQPDLTAPDGRLPLAFAWIFGHGSQDIVTSATSYVEARDLVLVLDYSASMNDDSTFVAFPTLGQSNVESNMADIYSAMGSFNLGGLPWAPEFLTLSGQAASGTIPHVDVTFRSNDVQVASTMNITNVTLRYSNGNEQQFAGSGLTGTFTGTGSNANKRIDRVWVKSGTNSTPNPGSQYSAVSYGERFMDTEANIKTAFGLNSVTCPYGATWSNFVSYVKDDSQVNTAGYRKKYGKLTFLNYLLTQRPRYSQTSDFWKAPCYPCDALKKGCSAFCDFVTDLNFNDRVGLVIYDTTSRVEYGLSGVAGAPTVDLGDEPLTYDIEAIDTIQKHKQAGHYDTLTGIGYGLLDARNLLNSKARVGAKKVVFLMTDGLANQYPSGWNLPSGFDWISITDIDADGDSDYSTSDKAVKYALYQASQLINQGVTIHTLCVGSGADTLPMQCIAAASGGEFIVVPGGTSVAQMQSELLAAFGKVAGKVPPPELTDDD
jgi:Flp pilus assembly protein TadG